jgi:hypothetical protein
VNEFLQFNVGQIAQVTAVLIAIGIMYQQIRGDITGQSKRLEKIESQIEAFQQFLINSARYEQRLVNLAETVTAQGKRLDRFIYNGLKVKDEFFDDE